MTPTPATHPCADAGRSVRRAVEPRNTILRVGLIDEGCIDDFAQPSETAIVSATAMSPTLTHYAWAASRATRAS